ncbi:MAG: lytic transglycosylase domain-containing protein [Armatimonadota bacterium]|nr:lytic transglycosylase domain-containing protein [Armatimonadota bacterium]MDR5696584.1 lytic transglycosylase domain-containing protein [Armatimonadota bacterium]
MIAGAGQWPARCAFALRALAAWVLGVVLSLASAAPSEARPRPEQLGFAHYHNGEYRQAAAAFRRALAGGFAHGALWLWLGAAEFRAGNALAAVGALERARARLPQQPDVLLWLGYAYEAVGMSHGATSVFDGLLAVAPRSAAAELVRRRRRASVPVGAIGMVATDPWTYAALARRYNRRLTIAEADRIGRSVVHFGRHHNLDPRLVAAVIAVESGFEPRAVSVAGAQGLGQLMPATARAVGVHDPFSIEQNVYGTVRVLRGHLDRYGYHNVALALAAYNAGSGAVRAYGGVPPYPETSWYVYNVMSLYRRLVDGR